MIAGANGLAIDGSKRVLRRRRVVRRPARHAAPALPGRLARGPRARRAAARAPHRGVPRAAGRARPRRADHLARLAQAGGRGADGARLRAGGTRVAPAAWPSSARSRARCSKLSSVGDRAAGEYVFVDEWDVRAPLQPVFDALADGRTYPEWWKPVYIAVEADGPPQVGAVSRQHFKGRLPYHLHTTSEITELEPPTRVVAEVEGDLRGRGDLDADRRRATASRTSASTGRCSPTASCCARSRPCCARSSARTTTGRSPARWRAWSRTRSARRRCATTPGRASPR